MNDELESASKNDEKHEVLGEKTEKNDEKGRFFVENSEKNGEKNRGGPPSFSANELENCRESSSQSCEGTGDGSAPPVENPPVKPPFVNGGGVTSSVVNSSNDVDILSSPDFEKTVMPLIDAFKRAIFNNINELSSNGYDYSQRKEKEFYFNFMDFLRCIKPEKDKLILRRDELKEKCRMLLQEKGWYDEYKATARELPIVDASERKPHSFYAAAFLTVFKLKKYNDTVYYASVDGYSPFRPIMENFLTTLDLGVTKNLANEVEFFIKAQILDELQALPPNFILLKNGIYNIETDLFFTYDEAKELIKDSYYSRENAVNVVYDPTVASEFVDKKPEFQKFLDDVLDPVYHDLIYEIFGYCLYRSYPLQYGFILYGEGQNGKSTLLNVLTEFLGKHNVVGRSWQELEHNQFAKSSLKDKLANICADLPSKAIHSSESFKQLTGSDYISADKKYSVNPINFTNYAKVIFSANSLPENPDESYAFFRRIILIPFMKRIEKPDPFINVRLTSEKEKSMLFFNAVDALKRLLARQQFSYDVAVEKRREIYKRLSNPVVVFIEQCIEADPETITFVEDLYSAYTRFASKNKLKLLSEAVFSRDFNRLCLYDKQPMRARKENRLLRAYKGIKIKEEYSSTIVQEDALDVVKLDF